MECWLPSTIGGSDATFVQTTTSLVYFGFVTLISAACYEDEKRIQRVSRKSVNLHCDSPRQPPDKYLPRRRMTSDIRNFSGAAAYDNRGTTPTI